MIQRTQFNKLTLDRIEELFVPYFAGTIEPQMRLWRDAMEAGAVEGRQFYISLNDTWEMDGILMVDEQTKEGVIYTRTKETTHAILERAWRGGQVFDLTGDPRSCQWAQETNLPA